MKNREILKYVSITIRAYGYYINYIQQYLIILHLFKILQYQCKHTLNIII